MIAQKQDTFVAFVDGEVDFENHGFLWFKIVSQAHHSQNWFVREIYKKPWNLSIPGVQKSWFPVLRASSINQKNGETQRSHLHLHVCWRNPNKAQFVSCVVNMYMKIIISDQSQSYFHQLTISLLVETC